MRGGQWRGGGRRGREAARRGWERRIEYQNRFLPVLRYRLHGPTPALMLSFLPQVVWPHLTYDPYDDDYSMDDHGTMSHVSTASTGCGEYAAIFGEDGRRKRHSKDIIQPRLQSDERSFPACDLMSHLVLFGRSVEDRGFPVRVVFLFRGTKTANKSTFSEATPVPQYIMPPHGGTGKSRIQHPPGSRSALPTTAENWGGGGSSRQRTLESSIGNSNNSRGGGPVERTAAGSSSRRRRRPKISASTAEFLAQIRKVRGRGGPDMTAPNFTVYLWCFGLWLPVSEKRRGGEESVKAEEAALLRCFSLWPMP